MAIERKSNQGQADLNIAVGKTQPSALDMEEAVLGALMLEKDAVELVLDVLKPEAFYRPAHQKIYAVIKDIAERGDAIDMLTVTQELRNRDEIANVGGAGYIAQLSNKIASAAHIDYHARIIAQKFIQRELIRVTSDIQRQAFDNTQDVYQLLDQSEQELFNISSGTIKKEIVPIGPILDDAIELIQEAKTREFSGIPSGFPSIDKITQGWQKGDLVIIAARPSMGKTAFTLSMARNMAVEHNQGVAFFSLEMPSVQLVNRLIISETEIQAETIKTGKLSDAEWVHLEDKIQRLYQAPLYIDDSSSLSIFDLSAKCRRLKAKQKLDVVVIDYLQLMKAEVKGGNREQEVSLISRSLKQLAKDLNIPIIALAQLNRGVELRSGSQKRPMLADLRESGAIEQDADIIAFISRPERMGITEDEDGNSTKDVAEFIISKHRNGETADVNLRFRGEFIRFEEWDSLGASISSNPEVIQKFSSKMNEENPISNFEKETEGENFNTKERNPEF
jgi:replicative DNA helicase